MKILTMNLLSLIIFMHPLIGQQLDNAEEPRIEFNIAAGTEIRVLAPGIAERLARGDRIFPVRGIIESTKVDTIIFKSDYYDSLLCIPVASIKVLEIKHQLTKSEKARIAKKGYIGAGIGALAGGLIAGAFGSNQGNVRYALPILGAADGYFIGRGNRLATYGFLAGAAIGGAIGAYQESKDQQDGFLGEGAETTFGVILGGQAGMIVGGIIGLLTESEKDWTWKEIPLDKIQIGFNLQENGGVRLNVSLIF